MGGGGWTSHQAAFGISGSTILVASVFEFKISTANLLTFIKRCPSIVAQPCSDGHDDAELPLPLLPSFDVLSIGSIGKLQKAFHLLLLSLAPNFFSR